MSERIPIRADAGYVYTDGKGSYSDISWVVPGEDTDAWYQISRSEYEKMTNASEEEQATEEDYQNALRELGVKI